LIIIFIIVLLNNISINLLLYYIFNKFINPRPQKNHILINKVHYIHMILNPFKIIKLEKYIDLNQHIILNKFNYHS